MTDNQRVAIVTGGSSGIGGAIGKSLVKHGFRITLMARRKRQLKEIADGIGDAAIGIPVDVRNEQELLKAFDARS